MDGFWAGVIWSIVPTAVALGIFLYLLRNVVHIDRNERRAYAKIEAEERARRGLPPVVADAPTHADAHADH